MDTTTLFCKNPRRREEIRRRKDGWNGIDYLEVGGNGLVLHLVFINEAPKGINKNNVIVEGGRPVDVKSVQRPKSGEKNRRDVRLSAVGDGSIYTLRLVDKSDQSRTMPSIDPRYDRARFSFQTDKPVDRDCLEPESVCPPEALPAPELDYLAKDYAGFRQLILDRLAQVMPDWQERHIPDLGITLVELLAYVGDHLSYYQDAVATEAYLDTARQRISVRRHARLVDYHMHEGCNARVWVHVGVSKDTTLDPQQVYFITDPGGELATAGPVLDHEAVKRMPPQELEVFEPLLGEPDSPDLSLHDLKDAGCLTLKLCERVDLLSRYLHGQLSPKMVALLNAHKGDEAVPHSQELHKTLIAELNGMIREAHLAGDRNLLDVDRVQEVVQNAQPALTGSDRMWLNRRILEAAFPQEFARRHRPNEPIALYREHNEIRFYTWADQECCLPRGATSATLMDGWEGRAPKQEKQAQQQEQQPPPKEKPGARPNRCTRRRMLGNLQPGDVLIFEEVLGPRTGLPVDADPSHRHAVRLTWVEYSVDPLNQQPIVEISWATEDALPFPLCISTLGSPEQGCPILTDVSVARGNMVLVDHGQTLPSEVVGTAPAGSVVRRCEEEGLSSEPVHTPARFRPPPLNHTWLTFSQPLPRCISATDLLTQDPRQALPDLTLTDGHGLIWLPRYDLLASETYDCHFVVEMDNDQRAHLRFGDDELGRCPAPGTSFSANYRVGNGPAGNVGAETIRFVVASQGRLHGIKRVRNPLPSVGGTEPESIDEVKQYAPHAFRTELQRAVIADDYAAIVMRDFSDQVQRAVAVIEAKHGWQRVDLAVDPLGTDRDIPELLRRIAHHLERFRRIGHFVVVQPAEYVSLNIELTIHVQPSWPREQVESGIRNVLSNRVLPDGRFGFFHPDNLTFGQDLRKSKLVAVVQRVNGVEGVDVKRFQRSEKPVKGKKELDENPLGPLQIARLNDDPDAPENGLLILTLEGGWP